MASRLSCCCRMIGYDFAWLCFACFHCKKLFWCLLERFCQRFWDSLTPNSKRLFGRLYLRFVFIDAILLPEHSCHLDSSIQLGNVSMSAPLFWHKWSETGYKPCNEFVVSDIIHKIMLESCVPHIKHAQQTTIFMQSPGILYSSG